MRIAMLVSPNPFSAIVTGRLLEAGHTIAGFWSDGERPAWRRDKRLAWTAPRCSLTNVIRKTGAPLHICSSIKPGTPGFESLKAVDANVMLSAMFMRIVPEGILSNYGTRALNLHPSLLPRYRGPTPIMSMLMADDADTCGGVTLHILRKGIDTGEIIAQQPVPYPPNIRFRQWEMALARAASQLALDNIQNVLDGTAPLLAQPETHMLASDERKMKLVIDPEWKAETARRIMNRIGSLRPLEIQLGNRKILVRGWKETVGERSGAAPKLNLRWIEFDMADARIRLWRERFWTNRIRRIETVLSYRQGKIE